MPIYEYRCQSCGYEMDKLQKMSDEPLVDCPICNQPSLKKLISAAGFRLSGSGWYETDFKQGKKKNMADNKSSSSESSSDMTKVKVSDGGEKTSSTSKSESSGSQ
jgi:putative FmdB family regulatory protein